MQTLIGMRLGSYQIVEQIGRGGMATVFKAYQPSMDRYVAVKVLPRHLSEDRAFVERFNREVRILARLEHPHIVPVHDYGEQDGYTYLVMRLVEAGTLKDLITRHGPPDLPETARILDQVGEALDYAHSQGVLHRDIKPSNVLLEYGRDAFLTDFGIAKLVAETASFTGSGTIVGTPAYMSPEQCQGEAVDARCDIYALGVLLYEMVTGRVPYEAETPLAVVLKQIHEPPPLPRSVRPDLPESVERVILKAMAKKPAERWPTPREMVEALKQAVACLPGEERGAESVPPGQASTVIRAQVTPKRSAGSGRQQGIPAVAGVPVAASADASAATARARLEEPAPLPLAVPTRAAHRLRRWLPVAGGAVFLVAVIAVVLLVLRSRGGLPASATEVAVAASSVAGGTAALVPGAGTAASALPLAGNVPGWASFSNPNLSLALALGDDSLWLGGDGGLVRWNLSDGSYAKLGVADGLASGRINDLAIDRDGVLWAATAAGLSRFDGQTWTTYDRADGLDSNWVEALWLDADGGVWAGTADGERGLNYSKGAGWGPPPIPPLPVDEPTITALDGDSRADLWVGMAGTGLAHFDGQEWTILGSKDGLPGDRVLAMELTGDALWASFDDALVRFDRDGSAWERVREVSASAIYAASDGAVWFGTTAGVIRFDPATGDWQSFEPAAGTFPSERPVTDIDEATGTLWFATYGQGAVSYDGEEWKSWTTADRLGGNLIGAIRQGRDGAVWFTHPGTGLSRYEPVRDSWQSFGEADGATDWPPAPGVDSQAEVWIARDGALLSFDGLGWQTYAVPELKGVGVEAIDIGPGDVQWLRTDAGLMRHDPATGAWTTFGVADHPALAHLRALLIARDGTVWAGGEDGLVRYDGHTWSVAETSGIELRDVQDIAQAADDSLWLAADGSVIHLAGDKQYVYRRPDEGYLDRLAVAPDGSLWTGYAGVARLDPANNGWQLFGTADGMLDMRVTDILVTPDGTVWIGTEGGVSRYLPQGP